MAIDPRMRKALIIGGLAVAAYLIYRWYQNKQASQNQGNSLGTNLNSNPSLIGGSTGPTSGLQYYAGNVDVYTTNPVSQPSSTGGTSTGGTTGSTGGSSGGASGGTASWWQNGIPFSGTVQQFLSAFRATGQNMGQIVPGGTGQAPAGVTPPAQYKGTPIFGKKGGKPI